LTSLKLYLLHSSSKLQELTVYLLPELTVVEGLLLSHLVDQLKVGELSAFLPGNLPARSQVKTCVYILVGSHVLSSYVDWCDTLLH
jgi:hypothetical protein